MIKNKRCWFYAIVAYLIFLCIAPAIEPLLVTIVEKWVSKCSELWYAVIVILLSLIYILYVVWRYWKYNYYISKKDISLAFFLISVYLYYRFHNQTFDFWPNGRGLSFTDFLLFPFILLIVFIIFQKRKDTDPDDKIVMGSSLTDDHVNEGPGDISEYDNTAERIYKKKDTVLNNKIARGSLLVDEPITKALDDIFGYYNIAEGLLQDLNSVDLREHAYSVGITALWGYGKSSFLNLFADIVKERDIVVRFYPRSSKTVFEIQEDFFEELSIELSKRHSSIKHIVRRYVSSLQLNNGGSWISKIICAWNSIGVSKERDHINEVLKVIGKRVFVIIEDFDRLSAEEIQEVLKLIDRNANFRNTIFMTAYDKGYVNAILAKEFSLELSKGFTDKYFDYELSLPIQDKGKLSNYFSKYLYDHLKLSENDDLSRDVIISSWQDISMNIIEKLGCMRHVKRFINIFMSRYPQVKNDVDFADFMHLTLLRYEDINVYNAIFGSVLVRKGDLGTSSILCLRRNYKDKLKEISSWMYSDEILQILFPSNDSSIESPYKHIRNVNQFDLYFYDYYVGRVYYKDLIPLFRCESDSEAFSLIDNMLMKNQMVDLAEFLCSRTLEWLDNKDNFERYIKLLIYVVGTDENINLGVEMTFSNYLLASTVKNAIEIGVILDKQEYEIIMYRVMGGMVKKRPFQLGYLLIRVINDLLEDQDYKRLLAFEHQQFVGWAVSCQHFYFKKYKSNGWSYYTAVMLSCINDKKDSKMYSYPARKELMLNMKQHPDDWAKNLVGISLSKDEKILSLSLKVPNAIGKIFPVDNVTFEDWINSINDESILFVYQRVNKCRTMNEVLQIPALKKKYSGNDFDSFKEAILADDRQKQIDSVLNVCKNEKLFDLKMLADKANVNIKQVKLIVLDLIKKDMIDKRFGELKETIEPFENGDYVRLEQHEYDKLNKKPFDNKNIFRIVKIGTDIVKLNEIESDIQRTAIEPIPIDGVTDSDFYYDPDITGPIVSSSQEVPSYNADYSYYMDSLKKYKNSEGASLYNNSELSNCKYVHEMQHLLNKHNRNSLKVRRYNL